MFDESLYFRAVAFQSWRIWETTVFCTTVLIADVPNCHITR